jgi:hypothetical protein
MVKMSALLLVPDRHLSTKPTGVIVEEMPPYCCVKHLLNYARYGPCPTEPFRSCVCMSTWTHIPVILAFPGAVINQEDIDKLIRDDAYVCRQENRLQFYPILVRDTLTSDLETHDVEIHKKFTLCVIS